MYVSAKSHGSRPPYDHDDEQIDGSGASVVMDLKPDSRLRSGDQLPCPKCRRVDRVDEEEQTGSSNRWFVCARCGTRFSVPPKQHR